jgi:hypothetical protein
MYLVGEETFETRSDCWCGLSHWQFSPPPISLIPLTTTTRAWSHR